MNIVLLYNSTKITKSSHKKYDIHQFYRFEIFFICYIQSLLESQMERDRCVGEKDTLLGEQYKMVFFQKQVLMIIIGLILSKIES